MIVNTRDCFFLKIFMDLILGQQSTLIRRLVLSGDKSPLGDQRLSLSIVKLKSEFVKLLDCLMGHFEILFHLRNLGGILMDHIGDFIKKVLSVWNVQGDELHEHFNDILIIISEGILKLKRLLGLL